MNQLQSLHLKDVVSFKDTKVSLTDNNGFVVVQGQNLDSNIPGNSNGAGKSLLFGALPTALYEADPLALAKKNKKDIHKKGSSVHLEFDSGSGHRIGLEQKTSGYRFFIDGKDQKVQKQDIARAKLFEHWTLREEEFYTTCYINSQRSCDFQKSKPSDRLNFITNLFDLQIYDRLRAHFAKLKTEIKDKETEYQTFAVTLSTVERDLSALNWNKAKAKSLKTIKADSSKVLKALENLYSKKTELSSSLQAIESIEEKATQYFDAVKKLSVLGTLKGADKKLKSQVDYLESEEEYQEDIEAYKEKKQKLKASLDSILKDLKKFSKKSSLSFDEISDLIDTHSDKYHTRKSEIKSLESEIEDQKEINDQIDFALEDIQELGFETLEDIPSDDVSSQIEMAKAAIDIADDLDGHKNCPTCLQKINVAAINKAAKAAKKTLPKLEATKKAQKLLAKHDSLEEEHTDIASLKKSLKKLSKDMKHHKEQALMYTNLEKLLSSKKEAESLIASLSKPKPPKGSIHYKGIDLEQAESLLKKMKKLDKYITQLKTLLEQTDFNLSLDTEKAFIKEFKVQKKTVKQEHKKIKADIETQKELSKKLETGLVRLETAKSNWKLLSDQKLELDSKMDKAKPLIRKKKIVETLFAAYGSTNLKLVQAAKTLKLVEANLNKYSHMVFPESMVFNLDAGTRGIDAQVTRANGLSSDISKLSGAETNCFRLLFAISILPLIPAERRTNFMILDEPDSACSDAVREHIAKEFVPKLRAIVPHVFWITPKESDVFKEAELWTVKKHKGVSTIEVKR